MAWRLEQSEEFKRDVKRLVGKDGNLRNILEKKIRKIVESPERVGEGKTGPLAGIKSEYVGHHVILFEVVREVANPPGRVILRRFVHHNDRLYDPNG